MTSAHSPLPWSVGVANSGDQIDDGAPGIESADGWTVCDVWPSACPDCDSLRFAIANAEFIVRAVNSHADLLAALKAIVAADEVKSLDRIVAAIPAARAAIAKAEGPLEPVTGSDPRD
jgi:hypothetical protein